LLTDEALQNRTETDVKQMILYLSMTRFLGTVLAQVFFLPLASVVVFWARLLAK